MSESIIVGSTTDSGAIERWESEGGRTLVPEEEPLRVRSGEFPGSGSEQGNGSNAHSEARPARKRSPRGSS